VEEYAQQRTNSKKNKRGSAPSNPSEATLKITELFSQTLSFTGLQGFETGGFTNGKIVCTFKSKLAMKAYFLLLVVKKHNPLTSLRR